MSPAAVQDKAPRTFDFIGYSSPSDACFLPNQRTVRSRAARHGNTGPDHVVARRRKYAPSWPLQFERGGVQDLAAEPSYKSTPAREGEERRPGFNSQQQQQQSTRSTVLARTIGTSEAAERSTGDRKPRTENLCATPEGFDMSYQRAKVANTSARASRNSDWSSAHPSGLSKPQDEPTRSSNPCRHMKRSVSTSPFAIASDHLLGAGGIDPFRTTPLPWQPFLPALMHHYFTALASDLTPRDQTHWTRTVLRKTWWPVVLSDTTLFSATMLVAANHQSNQQVVRSPPGPRIWLKTLVLQSLRQITLDSSQCSSDATIGAMVTLAGCEFLYGDGKSYHIHMKAAKILVEARGGIHHMNPAGPLLKFLYWAGHDLCIFDGTEPYFEHPNDAVWLQFRRRSLPVGPLPPGLAQLETAKLVSGALLDIARVLAPMISGHATDCSLLRDIEAQLFTWSGAWTNSICPLHSELDDYVVRQADQSLRFGLLSITYRIMSRAGMIDSFYAQRRRQIFQTLDKLDCGVLKSTVWGEMAFWVMITTRASAGVLWPSDFELFTLLAKLHAVASWQELKRLLERYPYSSELYDGACQATWERVRQSPEQRRRGPSTRNPTLPEEANTRYELSIAKVVHPKFLDRRLCVRPRGN